MKESSYQAITTKYLNNDVDVNALSGLCPFRIVFLGSCRFGIVYRIPSGVYLYKNRSAAAGGWMHYKRSEIAMPL